MEHDQRRAAAATISRPPIRDRPGRVVRDRRGARPPGDHGAAAGDRRRARSPRSRRSSAARWSSARFPSIDDLCRPAPADAGRRARGRAAPARADDRDRQRLLRHAPAQRRHAVHRVHRRLRPGRERPADHQQPDIDDYPIAAMGCADQFRLGQYIYDDRLRDRRFPLVDEEKGIVLAGGFIDHTRQGGRRDLDRRRHQDASRCSTSRTASRCWRCSRSSTARSPGSRRCSSPCPTTCPRRGRTPMETLIASRGCRAAATATRSA